MDKFDGFELTPKAGFMPTPDWVKDVKVIDTTRAHSWTVVDAQRMLNYIAEQKIMETAIRTGKTIAQIKDEWRKLFKRNRSHKKSNPTKKQRRGRGLPGRKTRRKVHRRS